jgi:hypothetical protein
VRALSTSKAEDLARTAMPSDELALAFGAKLRL